MFGLNDDQSLRFVYLTVLLVLIVGSVGFGRSRRAGMLRHLGIWVLLAAALVVGYVYRGPKCIEFAELLLYGKLLKKPIE